MHRKRERENLIRMPLSEEKTQQGYKHTDPSPSLHNYSDGSSLSLSLVLFNSNACVYIAYQNIE